MVSNAFAVDKLDESNYDTWCVQMRGLLIFSDAWKIANGECVKPETDAENWIKADEKALALITLSVKTTQLNYIKNCATSNEAWKKLKDIYQPNSPIRKVTLYKSLLNLRLSGDGGMAEYLNEFTSIIEKLAETGISLNEDITCIILLSSLPQMYDNFIIAIETRDALPTFAILKQKLLQEAERRNHQNGTGTNEAQAFIAQKDKKKQNDGKCYNCGKRGHYATNCRQKKRTTLHKTTNNAFYSNYLFTIKTYVDSWCVDSGATAHMCHDRNMFIHIDEYNENIVVAGNKLLNAKGIGIVQVKTKSGIFTLKEVLYVPEIQINFLSVGKAAENGVFVQFYKHSAILINTRNKTVIAHAKKVDNLYIIVNKKEYLNLSTNEKTLLWHNRYGHINFKSLHEICCKKSVNGLDNLKVKTDIICMSCLKSKITVQPFNESENRATNLLEIIHADVCGPFNVNSIGGSRYFLTCIDDKSRFVHVYFLASKNEVFEKFKLFKSYVERQTGKKIKILRTDNGREFVNNNFNAFIEENGIRRQLTVPYTPQQNGVAERYNRTLVEMAGSMLVHAGLNESFWAEAVACAVHIRNRSSTRSLKDATPYEVWENRKPTVKYFKVFGCLAVALDKTYRNNKFKAKGKSLIMVGYDNESKGYRLYDPEKRNIVIRRDVKFDENSFIKSEETHDFTKNIWVCPESNSCNENVENDDENCNQLEDLENKNIPEEEVETNLNETPEAVNEPTYGPGRPKTLRTGNRGRPTKANFEFDDNCR